MHSPEREADGIIVDEFLLTNCVSKVCAIPRQKIVDLMHDCEGKMRFVCCRLVGKLEKLSDIALQTLKPNWDIECRNTVQRIESLPRQVLDRQHPLPPG